jgi:Uma2 family endonuclease
MATMQELITKEGFERIPDAFRRYEVDRGELVEVEPMGNAESLVAGRISFALFTHLGGITCHEVLGPEARFRLARDPDLIRGCDVSYVPKSRMPNGRPDSGVGDYIPALAVEIVSPNNSAALVMEKTEEWLDAGVEILWVVYPRQRCVYVYTSPTNCTILKTGDVLTGGGVLPGLEIPVDRLFS